MALSNPTIAPRPIALHLLRKEGLGYSAVLVFGGALVTAICAQIAIPHVPVPYTLQTFGVLMAGLALGSRLGFLSQTLYLGAGAMGAPVFQGFTGGSSALVHITAGYLWAFPLAAFLAGYLAEKGWDRSVLSSFTSMFLAQALILVLGTLWLSFYVGGLKTAWTLGCAPFLAVECLKALGLGVIMPGAWSLVKR